MSTTTTEVAPSNQSSEETGIVAEEKLDVQEGTLPVVNGNEERVNTSENDGEKSQTEATDPAIQDLSTQNKKALQFLADYEDSEEESKDQSFDVDKIKQGILEILNEGRKDTDLSKEQLIAKCGDLQEFISKVVTVLAEKTELCVKLEYQNTAYAHQAKTLKSVVAVTKDLLNIRNMEVEHLHASLKVLEEGIDAERTRHSMLLQKLKEAMNLNEKLKNEYNTQNGLFQTLRQKYQEKILIITKENERLHKLAQNPQLIEDGLQESGEVNNSIEVIEQCQE